MITTDFKHGAEFMYTIKKILVENKINHAIKITSLRYWIILWKYLKIIHINSWHKNKIIVE